MTKYMMLLICFLSVASWADENSELNSSFGIPIEPHWIEDFINFLDHGDPTFPSHWDRGNVLASLGDFALLNKYYSSLSQSEIASLFIVSSGTNNEQFLTFLLSKNIDVDITHHGMTGIGAALMSNSQDTLNVLLRAKADLHFFSDVGISTLNLALTSDDYNETLVRLVMKHKVACDDKTLIILEQSSNLNGFNDYSDIIKADLHNYCVLYFND